MNLSFIIPCYCSSKTIKSVVGEIKSTIREGDEYEIILVNDASPDDTFITVKKICEDNPNILGVNLAKNFGQHAALMAGFKYASGDIVICLDDDGQTPACEAYKLIDELNDETDVVYAKYSHKQHSGFRNLGSLINAKMTEWLLGKPKGLFISSYFAAKRYVIEEILQYNNPFPYVIGLVLRTTNNIKNVDVMHRSRKNGKSGYTIKKLILLWLNGFTAFSVRPLRIATGLGVTCAGVGFCYAIYTIINKLCNPNVVIGWSSTMAVLLIIGGMILFMLGMIGEYIGRIYISINNSPQYVVRDIVGSIKNEKAK